MVLLRLMNQLAKVHGWKLTVAHLNHKLRGKSSEADAALVKHRARALSCRAVVGAVNVRAMARQEKLSLEMAARKARHEFLARTASKLGIDSVALAHHADDQLELFFLRLLRGSGSQGLQGMRWRNPSPVHPQIELVRPLLGQTRAALAKYAAENKISFREDASNASLDIPRNRIRHELLPLLRKCYQPALDKVIARVLEITQAEADFVSQAAQRYLSVLPGYELPGDPSSAGAAETASKGKPQPSSGRKTSSTGTSFADLPVAVQRRSLQLRLFGLGIVPDFDLIEQLRLKEGQPVCVSRHSIHGPFKPLTVRRDSRGLVRIKTGGTAAFLDNSMLLNVLNHGGKADFDGTKVVWEFKSGRGPKPPKRVVNCEWFDADRVGSEILLRHWRPGDRFQPIGMPHAVKLQDFFTSQKVPRERRHRLILAATAQNEVFWVEGMRISERFKLTKSTNRRLQWRWQRL